MHAHTHTHTHTHTGDDPSKPGDDGRSESSAGDGGTEIDAQSATSGNSVSGWLLAFLVLLNP